MTTPTATSTITTVAPQAPSKFLNSAVAVYRHHNDAEDAVHRLERAGIPMPKISIIGRNFELREDVQGYYRPSDAALEGAGFGAWMGGLFGLLMGFGMFVFPVAGTLIVLGPLAGMIAGAVSGAGLGALVNGLMALGIPKDRALKYQSRLQAGEFLVTVTGTPEEVARAKEVLQNSGEIELETHGSVQPHSVY
jgi:heat induced stress protein YflT